MIGARRTGPYVAADTRAVAVAHGFLPTSSSGATQLTVASFGSVDATLVLSGIANSTSNPQSTGLLSCGFLNSTSQRCGTVYLRDGQGTVIQMDRHRQLFDGQIARELSPDGTATRAWTASAISNGVQLAFVSGGDSTGVSRYASALLLGNLSNFYIGKHNLGTTTGVQNVTAPGFRADVVLILANGITESASSSSNAIMTFGAAHIRANDTVSQGAMALAATHEARPTVSSMMLRSDCAVFQLFDDAVSWRASVGAHASGFTVQCNESAGGDDIAYLALELRDAASADVRIIDTRTSIGTQAHTGFGFAPKATILAGGPITALSTNTQGVAYSIGMADSSGGRAYCLTDVDNALTTDSDTYCSLGSALAIRNSTNTATLVDAAVSAWGSDGLTLNYTATNGTAYKALMVSL